MSFKLIFPNDFKIKILNLDLNEKIIYETNFYEKYERSIFNNRENSEVIPPQTLLNNLFGF